MEKERIRAKFASNVRIRRKMTNLTQRALGIACGYPGESAMLAAYRWEHEQTIPDIYHLITLAKVLHCSIDDLFK